jgi:hypothetical protein
MSQLQRYCVRLITATLSLAALVAGQAWSHPSPSTPPAPRVAASAVYDSANNRLIVYGGQDADCNPSYSFGDTWILQNANGSGGSMSWTQLLPANAPEGRRGHSAVYDSTNNIMIVFGGDNICATAKDNHTLVLSNANGLGSAASQWTQLSPAGAIPPGRDTAVAGYDAAHNRLIVFGGFSGFAPLGDVWVLSNANGLGGTPQWTQLNPTNAGPGALANAAGAYDAASNTLIVFGGFTSCCWSSINDVWLLSNADGLGSAAPQWTKLSPSGTPPSARFAHLADYDAQGNQLVVYGGFNGVYALNDAWVLSSANGKGGTPAWKQLSPTGNVPTTYYNIANAFDPGSRTLMMFAGSGNGSASPGQFGYGPLNGYWLLSNATGAPPNQAPSVSAGADPTVQCTGPNGASVTLTGSASDPDNDKLMLTWTEGTTVLGHMASLTVQASLGTHTYTFTADDGRGAVVSSNVIVNVVDTTAPALSFTLSPNVLWPPNGKLVKITATVNTSDACGATPRVALVSITSNEPPRHHQREWVATLGTDTRVFWLRAARNGHGKGRIYVVTYTSTDASGNTATSSQTVLVPHDEGKHKDKH